MRRVWRSKGTAHDPKHTTSSVKHGGGSDMTWVFTAANGIGSLLFVDDVTVDKNSRMYFEVCQATFSQMLQNLLDGTSQCNLTMICSMLQKQSYRVFLGKEVECQSMAKSITWIGLNKHFTCWGQNWREMPQEQPRTEVSRRWCLGAPPRMNPQCLVMSTCSRLQAVIYCKGKFNLWLVS